ncbi:heme-binding protein [Phyllobacterium sp. SB3]|uniref:GlcG/HbpS family heme-binding protein n=1 Tax=Phyllobacterium sp. SB3 TaxID=3156073 RepID=UPI0032B022B1
MNAIKSSELMKAMETSKQAAQQVGRPYSIAVMDSGRNLLAFLRMEGAPLGTIEAAQGKAFAASSLAMSTSDLSPLVQPGAALYGLAHAQERPFVSFGGGIPVFRNGALVGSVGASGGTIKEDIQVAQAIVDSLEAA